jgi:hypothetical protein
MHVENMESLNITEQDSNDKENSNNKELPKYKKSVTWSDVVRKRQPTNLPFTSTK